jgi:diguanylate cyclase (GGDEF)-like protein
MTAHAPNHLEERLDRAEETPGAPESAAGILGGDIRIPSPPAVAIRVLKAVRNEDVTAEELVRIISSDPALAVKVLRLANSPVYTRSGKIDSVKKAVSVLGIRVVKNLALSFVVVDGINAVCGKALDFESFWRRSIIRAASACVVCEVLSRGDDNLFMSALLQDIGEVILALHFAERYRGMRREAEPQAQIRAEREAFGLDHQEVGYQFLTRWELPGGICDLVRHHHGAVGLDDALGVPLSTLKLAGRLASLFQASHSGQNFDDFSTALRAQMPVDAEKIQEILNAAHDRAREILGFFDISAGSMKNCSQILQEANEELGKLNLTYEQLVLELRRAKEKAERYASELAAVNTRLQELAYTDPLTGLFNHGYFQQLIERELARAARYSRPLSLILFDLDHFKAVNDEHGHPVGDEVLRRVSEIASRCVRQVDSVARYGGEEFAVILPETDSEGAVILGERIRKTLEKTSIQLRDITIRVTISIGIYTYKPDSSSITRAFMINAADKALYFSKRNGRNKSCVYKA